MESDVATDWFSKGPDLARARPLAPESGYDGRPVLIMQATNIDYMRNTAEVLAQELRSIGFNVQLLPLDWGSVVRRRSNKSPPEQGGWSVFITSATGNANSDVVNLHAFAATGGNASFGWPDNALHEELRERWSQAATLQERQAITRQLQENAWNYVHHVYFGQWVQPTVHRRNITGLIPVPGMVYWWNVRKT